MQFIECIDGVFQVTNNARECLSTRLADVPLSIVTVVGSYRIGKSSLLNWLTGIKDVFPTSDEVHAKTRGLWMAKELHNEHILYLDSEGLSNVEITDRTYDLSIFALCIALSSKLIVNTGHVLKSEELKELQDVGKIAVMLNQCGEIKNHAPDLLWIFRNATLKLTDPETKEPISATQYLETSLMKINPQISTDLFELFPKRHAIALPKPSANDQDIINQNFDKFTPKFQNAFDLVKQEVILTEPKIIGDTNVKLTGYLFLAMADALCKVLSSPLASRNMNIITQGITNAAHVHCYSTIVNETRQFIQKKCDKRKSLCQQTMYLPSQLVLNLHEKLMEIPTFEYIANLLNLSALNIHEQEKSHCERFMQQLKNDLNEDKKTIYDVLHSFLQFYSSSLDVDFLRLLQEKTQHMHAEKWALKEEEIQSLKMDIANKESELISMTTNIQDHEVNMKIQKENEQEKQSLIDRLNIELSHDATERLKLEEDINQLKIEANSANESVEQYVMLIKELKTKWETKNEDKIKLEQLVTKHSQVLQTVEDLQQCIKKQVLELESKKQIIDELQEKFNCTQKEHSRKIDLIHLDIVNERARNVREEERCAKRLKVYQDAAAQHLVETNELISLRQQKISHVSKISELQTLLNSQQRSKLINDVLRNF